MASHYIGGLTLLGVWQLLRGYPNGAPKMRVAVMPSDSLATIAPNSTNTAIAPHRTTAVVA